MAVKVGGGYHLHGYKRIGTSGDITHAVGGNLGILKIRKLVYISARLHSEMPDDLKGNLLREHRDIKHACFLDELAGQITLLAGHGNSGGVFGDLKNGVGNASVFLLASDRQNVKPVGQLK